MKVTPWQRLSEKLISEGILAMYRKCSLVPPGISETCLETWSLKMAMGARKVVQKFRKCYSESDGSHSVKLRELKEACRAASIPKKPSFVSESSNGSLHEEDLNEIADAQPAPLDQWQLLASKIKEMQLKKSQEIKKDAELAESRKVTCDRQVCMAEAKKRTSPDTHQSSAASEGARPVATPARNKYELPEFLLGKLEGEKKPSTRPFVVQHGPGDEVEENPPASECKPKKKGKGAQAKKTKAAKAKVVADAEVEAALGGEEEGSSEKRADDRGAKSYKAGVFREIYQSFLKEKRKTMSYAEANAAWMASDIRAGYLNSLSESEKKKRRFVTHSVNTVNPAS